MTLIAEAEKAADIADALGKFKVAVTDAATEITALVSELYAVGSILRDTDTAIKSPEYGRNIRLIEDDLDLARTSLAFTLEDIFRILGGIGAGAKDLTTAAYRQTWEEICTHFRHEGRQSLCARLEMYRRFLLELCKILRRLPTEQS